MSVALHLLYGVLGIAALYYGAEFLVRGGVNIARKRHIPPLVIGLTLVACATSASELVVSVNAALTGNPDISLGNVVGSSICNIALVPGNSDCRRLPPELPKAFTLELKIDGSWRTIREEKDNFRRFVRIPAGVAAEGCRLRLTESHGAPEMGVHALFF